MSKFTSAKGTSAARADEEKQRLERTAVKRYWPGKAPHWHRGEEPEEEEEAVLGEGGQAVAPPVVVKRVDDPRLQRLAKVREEDGGIAKAEIVSRRRRRRDSDSDSEEEGGKDGEGRRRPQDLSSGEEEEDSDDGVEGDVEMGGRGQREESSEDEEDEAAREARRAAVRERLKNRQEVEVLAKEVDEGLGGEEEDEDEEEESEYETDSEEEAFGRTLLKPIFVPKADRDTIREREALEAEEEAAALREKARLEQRKQDTRTLVATQVAAEVASAAAAAQGEREFGDVDTDDEKDEEENYEAWKHREMTRVRRDREERERERLEAEEREAVKNMTDAERRLWEASHPKDVSYDSKKKWKFMQKYWHKGAYFQDKPDAASSGAGGDAIFTRDFSGATGEDKMDRTILPKVMQVKNFGRRGRTKYTHLVDQDTSNLGFPYDAQGDTRSRLAKALAGTEEVFSKPKKYKT